jgi:hypothetical protein
VVEEVAYVYGILPAAEQRPISTSGVGGSGVGVVECAGVAALTSRLRGTALGGADVRAHWRVLEEAFGHATVLPLRFGMMMDSEEAVRERLLEPNAERLVGLLRQMTGLVQLNVKGRYDEQLLLRDIVRSNPAVAALRKRLQDSTNAATAYSDRIRLGQLVGDAIERRRDQDASLALRALEPLAVAASVERAVESNAAFNLAFLVERDEQPTFDERVTDLRDELGERIQIRYLGPLPPYSFAEAELGTGSAAWD